MKLFHLPPCLSLFLFLCTLQSHRPGTVGPLAAAEAAVEQRSGSVPPGGSHHQVCCETGGHRGAGQDQTTGEKRQGERGMKASEGGGR